MISEKDKLIRIINEGEELQKKDITNSDPDFKAWKLKAERFLISQFGEKSHEYEEFQKIHFGLYVYTFKETRGEWVAACQKGIREALAFLRIYVEEVPDSTQIESIEIPTCDFKKVFIVHGHDGELKEAVARTIEKQGIEAVILSEQTNTGRTIIEKFEAYSDVSGAICLFTADDTGKKKAAKEDLPRARQNVVFETGYFMGKLGRDHVVILADKGVEIPSDLSGVVYTDTNNWQLELLKELNAIGYFIDFNKLFK